MNVQGANRDVYCAAGWVALVHANEYTPGVRDTITPRHAKMDIMVPNAFTVFDKLLPLLLLMNILFV